MPWINSANLEPDTPLSANFQHWIYNALDSCITMEVLEALQPELNSPEVALIYKFERAMQGPAMDMMRRGFKVDPVLKHEMIEKLSSEQALYEERLNTIAQIVWGKALNARSPLQVKEFFRDYLRIPIPIKRHKGEEKESMDRKVLESLRTYLYARPVVNHILAIRDRTKSLGVLRSGVDSDGRIRTSYNVASTETGRWSSSENAFGTGTNLQNITERLRRILVADQGFKLCYADLEQAESRAVALLTYDALRLIEAFCLEQGINPPEECALKEVYLNACESGDLHTAVAIMTWPEMPWTGDIKQDKKLADDSSRPFYRDFTYRDIAKRLGHGSNYDGSPFGMAQIIAVEAKVIEAFQKKYFKAFPLKAWHRDVTQKVQTQGFLTTPLGRKRQFFARRSDDATIREAIAFQPQSMVGDLLNLGLYRVWDKHKSNPRFQLLAQIHDAICFQYREEDEKLLLPTIPDLLEVTVKLGSRSMRIPSDQMVGWNFSKQDPDKKNWPDGNPDGLMKYRGHDDRKRTAAADLLDRIVR